MDIAPGAEIALEIIANPRSAAAEKTLNRICAKDPEVAKNHRWHKRNRPSWQDWIRGGKFWHHQMKSRPAAKVERGRVFNVRATVDVIRDIESVKNCVKVTAK